MSNDPAERPNLRADGNPRPRLGLAKGRFEVPDVDARLAPDVQGCFEGSHREASLDRPARKRAIDQARANVRLSGTIVPAEVEQVNQRAYFSDPGHPFHGEAGQRFRLMPDTSGAGGRL
jgi:hypothetical protein